MKTISKSIVIFLVLTLCLTAFAESALAPFIDAAEKLAFETDNVTVTGKADFLLDGKRFKTAEITYVQDGENSFWQEKLLTPRDWRPDRVSGFTVVQNGEEIFVTETLHPGMYRNGFDLTGPESTLLRRSPMTDLLLAMARTAANRLEPFFGSAVTLEEREDGSKELKLELRGDSSPEILSFLANLGMRWVGERLFGIGMDSRTVPIPLDNISMAPGTETKRILCDTKELTLEGVSVRIGLDASGRLTAASGSLSARLKYYKDEDPFPGIEGEGWVRVEDGGMTWIPLSEQTLTVCFEAALSGYGESRAASFDATGLQAVSRRDMFLDELHRPEKSRELNAQEETRLEQRGRELCLAAGIEAGERTRINPDGDGWVSLCFDAEDGPCRLTMTEGGLLLELILEEGGFEENGESEEACPDELKQPVLDFLRKVNPELDVGDLVSLEQVDGAEGRFIVLLGITQDGAYTDTLLYVRLAPQWRIEEYTCLGHG